MDTQHDAPGQARTGGCVRVEYPDDHLEWIDAHALDVYSGQLPAPATDAADAAAWTDGGDF